MNHPGDELHAPFVVRAPSGDVRIGTVADLLAAMATTFHGQAVEVFEISSGRFIATSTLNEARLGFAAAPGSASASVPGAQAELSEALRRAGLDVAEIETSMPVPVAPATGRIRRPTTDASGSDNVVAPGSRLSSGSARLGAAASPTPTTAVRTPLPGKRPSSQQRQNGLRPVTPARFDAERHASGGSPVVRLAAILGIILMIAGGVALWMRLSGMSAPVIAVSAIPRPVAEPAAQAQAASTPVAPVTAPAARQAPPVAVPEAQQIRVRPPTVAQAPSVEEDTVPEKPAEKPVEEAPVAAPRTPPSTRGLQMWLPFSFTIQPGANLSPSHLMAAVTGAVRVVEDAQRHHVARFDGHGSIAFANPADGAFTLTCWLRTTQDANPAGGEEGASWRQGTGVIAGDVPGGKADFGLCTLAGRCAFGSGAPDVTLLSTGRVNDGAWHHIAAVRDGVGNLTLYIDGHNDGTRPGGLEPRDATTRLTVGSLQNGTHGFIGDLDEVRVYDRPLEDDEIASMFASEQVTDH